MMVIFLKINTRPVIFVHLASLEEQYRIHISCNICASVEEFEKMIENEKKKDFEYLIGYNDSLQSVVDTCKATISYPPKGLPFFTLWTNRNWKKQNSINYI